MTPQQLQSASTKKLLEAYNDKARCKNSYTQALGISRQLKERINPVEYQKLSTAVWHMMEGGESDAEFNEVIKELKSKYK